MIFLCRALLADAFGRLRKRGPLALSVGLPALLGVALFAYLPGAALLRIVGSLDDDVLRRNSLHLVATSVTLGWILSQGLLRVPMTGFLDLRPYLCLPVRFRSLCAIRLGGSLLGWWLLFLGPAAVHGLLRLSDDLLHAATTAVGGVALVLIIGRLISLLALAMHHLSRRLLGSLATLAAFVAIFGSLEYAFASLAADPGGDAVASVADRIASSRTLPRLGHLPPGLLARVYDAENEPLANLMRVAALWSVAGVLTMAETRVLRRRYLSRPAAGRDAAQAVLPLAALLGTRRATPFACLVLAELESILRAPLLRATVLMSIGFVFVHGWRPDEFLAVAAGAALPIAAVSQLKSNVLGSAHRHLAESFSLPLHLSAHPLARHTALNILSAIAPAAGTGTAVLFGRSPSLAVLSLWVGLPTALILAGDIVCGWADIHWPRAVDYGGAFPSGGNQAGSTLMLGAMVATVGAFMALFALGSRLPNGPALSIVGAVAIVGGLFAARRVFRRWQRSTLAADRGRILAQVTAH